MRNRSFPRTLAAWMITLLFFGSLLAGVHAQKPEGGASARATDLEPDNNSPATAVQLTNDEVIYGSLMTTVANDYQDFYMTSVPYGSVLNASLCTVDRDPAIPWRVNFQIIFWYNSGGNLASIMSSYTENLWDNLIWLQVYSQTAMDVWVEVRVNHTNQGVVTSEKGNYTLSATVKDPTAFGGGQVTGYMDKRNGANGGFYYKLSTPIADNKMAIGKLQCPVNGDFDLYVYNLWPRYEHPDIGPLWLVNASWNNDSQGHIEEVHVSGSESNAYYIFVQAFDGAGTYTLNFDLTSTAAPDDNNVPAKAVLIRDNYPHAEYADQGIDSVDWWKVNAKAGREIPEFFFTLTSSASNNLFAMLLFDQNLNFKSCKYNTQTGGWPNFGTTNPNPIMNSVSIKNTVVGYDGPIYICIQAIAHFYGGSEGGAFIPSKGDYKMTFTLPNTAPVYAGGMPEQHMLEDTTLETLVLANFFSDPDGDALSYSVVGSSYSTHPVVDNQTGLVKFTPAANWSGTETVRFRAIDDGPGNKFAEANVSVIVDPVNDPPFLVSSISDFYLKENDIAYTPDLTTIFKDIDNQLTDMKFNLKVVASNTHPPASALPYQYDSVSRSYKLGPCNLFFGTYDVQVTCTDGVTGTVPVPTTFKVNVAHINHRPSLRENIADPMELTIKEHEKDDHLALADLFVDVDVPEDYANDALTYTVTGEQRLLVSITDDGYLVIDTGKEQYIPGNHYEEKLVITAKDRAGLKATLNMTVFIDPVNDPPRIVNSMPVEDDLEISENTRKLFSVTAVDDDSQDKLTYNWYVNGKKDKNAKGLTFSFEPDYDTGGNVYTIKVDVFDGTTTVTHEWNVTVLDVNRLPSGYIKSPLNMTKFKKGTMVVFQADGTDPDTGDVLTFIWKDANGIELGRGTTLSTDKLPKGTQTITLETNDSKAGTLQTVTIIVWAPAPANTGTPGFEGLFAMAAIGFVLLMGAIRKLKQRN
jgi:hypothetical protein